LLFLLAVPLLRDWGGQVAAGLAEIGRIRQVQRQGFRLPEEARKAMDLDEQLGEATLSLQQVLRDLVSWMCSPLLPVVLGFALALRRGAVDLSVWVTAGAGGLLAAALIRAGAPPGWALLAATGGGAAVGLGNGLLVSRLGWPAPAVTLTVAAVIWLCLRVGGCPDVIEINEFAFDGVTEKLRLPLATLRMLLVLGSFSVVVVVVVMGGRVENAEARWPGRRMLLLALCGCGALAALSGGVKLLDVSRAFRPRIVEDLRIPAAAVLAGAAVFAGRGRTLLVCLLAPLAGVLAGQWARCVWDWEIGGYLVQVLLLIVMAAGTHASASAALAAGRPWAIGAWAGAALGAAGMVLVTFSGGSARPSSVGLPIFIGGMVVWVGGLTAGALCRLARRYAKRQG
jgi:ribose transport system permease protein